MKKHHMLMNHKTWDFYDGNVSQTDLQIQCKFCHNFTCLFWRNWQVDTKTHMEIQGIQNSQNTLGGKKNEQNWRIYISPISKLTT